MRGGRIAKKTRKVSAKSDDLPILESKALEPEAETLESQPSTQPSTIHILFNNANMDGSISDSAENLELLKKLWTEFEKTTEFNIEDFKTVRILMNMFQQNIQKILFKFK